MLGAEKSRRHAELRTKEALLSFVFMAGGLSVVQAAGLWLAEQNLVGALGRESEVMAAILRDSRDWDGPVGTIELTWNGTG